MKVPRELEVRTLPNDRGLELRCKRCRWQAEVELTRGQALRLRSKYAIAERLGELANESFDRHLCCDAAEMEAQLESELWAVQWLAGDEPIPGQQAEPCLPPPTLCGTLRGMPLYAYPNLERLHELR